MPKQLMRVHDILFFRLLVSVKYKFETFLALKFLIGQLSVGLWLMHLASGQWLVGMLSVVGDLLIGGFNEIHY